MKKKKIELAKKLTLAKETVATLTVKQKNAIKGGETVFCDTYDPAWTCESNPRPTNVCM